MGDYIMSAHCSALLLHRLDSQSPITTSYLCANKNKKSKSVIKIKIGRSNLGFELAAFNF